MRINEAMLRGRNQNRSTVACTNGVVCTSQPLASMAGVDVLKQGGNAVDAAVCANAMLGLVEPMSCGPGGDLFAIVWIEKENRLYGLNACGRSPYEWDLDAARALGLTETIPPYSPLSWSVPGCVSGWAALIERFGSRTLAAVLEPAIHYASEGFPVSPIIATEWRFDPAEFPTLAQCFMPDGAPLRFGDVFRNPDLAGLYGELAQGGHAAFYEGRAAERVAACSRTGGGRLALRDMAEHTVDWVEPVKTTYRGYEVWEIPPNGQGIAVLQMLNLLERYDISALEPNSPEHLHLFVEAKKLAYEDRAVYYADMDLADVPLDRLISKEYADARAAHIDPKRASDRVEEGIPDQSDTVYLAAADAEGNMVSLIQSIYHGWGSHIVPEGLGFAMQNRGMSFALDPGHRNRLEPHKRPFHTIIPGFVTKAGRPVFAFGVMGGDFQPQGQVQVLMNLIDFGMSPQQAGDRPRVAHEGSSTPEGQAGTGGGRVCFEPGFPDATKHALAGMGHDLAGTTGAFGGYQGIWREDNPRRYFAGSDPRKDGCAAGY